MYTITSSEIIPQGITETSTEKLLDVGTRVSAINSVDNTASDYIYALGVAGTAADSLVYVDDAAFTTALAAGDASGIRAIAMSANVALSYGWYRIDTIANGLVSVTTTPVVVDASYNNKVVVVSKADGAALTVPAATGSGNKFTVIIGETITSGSTTITAPGGTSYHGGTSIRSAADNTASSFEATGTTITLDGTTTGGGRGDKFELVDMAAGLYSVQGLQNGSGTLATPFS